MAKRTGIWINGEPCVPCQAKQQELWNAAAEGRVVDAAKAALIGAAMLAGLIPKVAVPTEQYRTIVDKLSPEHKEKLK